MAIDTNTVVSMEANQGFSKVAGIVDQYGRAVVLKDNALRYLAIKFAHTPARPKTCPGKALASAT